MYLFPAVLIESRVLRCTNIMNYFISLCHSYLAHYYGKKKSKRIGRPPGGHSNLACALKKASKRRKRRKSVFVHKKKRSSASVDNSPVGSPQVWDLMYPWHLEANGSLFSNTNSEREPGLPHWDPWPVEDGFVAPELVYPHFQWTFSHFPLGKWGWRWGWPRWRRWRLSKWGQYFWAAGRATGRVRNVRKKVMFLFSHPKWDIHITACRKRKEEKGASVFLIFWWWEQASFTKGAPFFPGLLSRI